MARPSKVPVTYAFGRRDRIDPKLAPFGVLKTGRNLRIRKDGRLGTRHGFEALDMTTPNGTLVAYDLHEYRGRLLALGTDSTNPGSNDFQLDLFEYLEHPTGTTWMACDRNARRMVLNPFRNLHEVAGIPQLDDGVALCDGAAGGGYVCLAYSVGATGQSRTFVLVVDATTDQTLHQQEITQFTPLGSYHALRVIYSGGTFYVGVSFAGGNSDILIRQFTPGSSTSFTSFASITGGPSSPTTAFDMCAVRNASTARLVVAADASTATNLRVYVFNSAGSQLGSTITVSGTNTRHVSIDADQTDDTINVFTIETASDGRLRTFNFAGSLLDGPTTTTSGTSGFICRSPAVGLAPEFVVMVINDGSGNVSIQSCDVDTHSMSTVRQVKRALVQSRPVTAQPGGLGVVFSALVAPSLTGNLDFATNALFYYEQSVAHMSTRDLLVGKNRGWQNLSFDTLTGKLCWVALRDPGVGIAMPVVTMLDFKSTARVESAKFGGLLYFAGATPTVYDGRFPVALNFNELPAVVSATPSNGAGFLSSNATYKYVVVWEYTLANGSVIVGPASLPFDASTGAGEDTMTVVVTTPHTISVALGDTLYGANVSAALYRTGWNAVAGIPGSVFNRCAAVPVAVGMANYGAPLTITDLFSDAAIATNEILYTQDERGPVSAPLQHQAPRACEHIAATEARLITGGLTKPELMQVSKAAYLEEAFEFNQVDVYFSMVDDDVTGVASLDGVKLVFTADSVFALGGDGPDDIGVGTLAAPVEIPSPGGLKNPWSLLKAPDGLWFQLDDTKLFRMPRGGGSPTWEGIDIHDTLTAYPSIVGTARHQGDNVAVFACTNSIGTDSRFLVRDFRTEQWFEDEPFVTTDGAGIEALTSYGDTIAYLSLGVVYWQVEGSFTDGAGVFISTLLQTQPLYPFGVGGYGQIYELLLTGEYRDNCKVDCRVSYDDGQTFTGLESFNLEDLTPGQTIQRKWTLPQDITSSIVIEFACTESLGGRGPTEGFVFNQVDLLVGAEEGLRELTAEEMA